MTKKIRRKLKDYDDALLVDLIARGDMTKKQIAQRVGISRPQVSMISAGRSRGDLQPRINAAARAYLREVRRRPGRQAGTLADKPPPIPSHRHKEYDDDRLVELIAAGSLSHAKIAREIGISKTMVSRIARGEARPDLQPSIGALVRSRREQFERLGVTVLKALLVKQARVALEGHGETARKAREHIIDTFRYPPDPAKLTGLPPEGLPPGGEPARRPMLPLRSMTELSPPLFAAVLKELGGPEPGPEDYAEAGVPYPGPDEDEETGDWLHRPEGLSRGEPQAAGPQGVPVPISGAAPTAPAQEDAAALQQNDVASRSRCPSGSGPSAEPFDAAQGKPFDAAQGKQEEAMPLEEGCSRNKKRRRRQRREVNSFLPG